MKTVEKEIERNGKKYIINIAIFEFQKNKNWIDFVIRDKNKNVIFEVNDLLCEGKPDIDKGINMGLDFLEKAFESTEKDSV